MCLLAVPTTCGPGFGVIGRGSLAVFQSIRHAGFCRCAYRLRACLSRIRANVPRGSSPQGGHRMKRAHATFRLIAVAALLCTGLAAPSASAQGKRSTQKLTATLMTDETDYEPGTTAVLTGAGFVSNEV